MKVIIRFIVILTIIITTFFRSAYCQNTGEDFSKIYTRISSQKFFCSNNTIDTTKIVEVQELLNFLDSYLHQEIKMNGKAGFTFKGNNDYRDELFELGVNGGFKQGYYPYEFDFSLKVEMEKKNTSFKEELSDIDVSFDFHPFPKFEWEGFIFATRFSDEYLGIEERYDIGLGLIYNMFCEKLTDTGNDNENKLNIKPLRDLPPESKLNITYDDTITVDNIIKRFKKSNIKRYSKLRLALLGGIYYEIEKAFAKNSINFNGRDTTRSKEIPTRSEFMFELRPTVTWQPKDNYKLKIYPYLKCPFKKAESISDKDHVHNWIFDLLASFEIEFEKKINLSLNYRYIYKNIPFEVNLEQTDGTKVPLAGPKEHSNFGILLNFKF